MLIMDPRANETDRMEGMISFYGASILPKDQQWLREESYSIAAAARNYLGLTERIDACIDAIEMTVGDRDASVITAEQIGRRVKIPALRARFSNDLNRSLCHYLLIEEVAHAVNEYELVGQPAQNTILNELLAKAFRDYYSNTKLGKHDEYMQKLADSPKAYRDCARFAQDALALDASDHSSSTYRRKITELTERPGSLSIAHYLHAQDKLYMLIAAAKVTGAQDAAGRRPLSSTTDLLMQTQQEVLTNFFTPAARIKGERMLQSEGILTRIRNIF